MKFILDNWVLILVAFASGAMLIWPVIARSSLGGALSTSEAVRLINREKAVLIDVCEPEEYSAGHPAGARNVPLGAIAESKQLPSNKALPVIVTCASGSRAARAAAALRKAGFENARALAGGNAAWREASLPIEKSS